jgi:hypothetical protein
MDWKVLLSFLALAGMFVGGVCWAISRIPAKPIRYGCFTMFLGWVVVSQVLVAFGDWIRQFYIGGELFEIAHLYVLVIGLGVAWFTWNRRPRKPRISQNQISD